MGSVDVWSAVLNLRMLGWLLTRLALSFGHLIKFKAQQDNPCGCQSQQEHQQAHCTATATTAAALTILTAAAVTTAAATTTCATGHLTDLFLRYLSGTVLVEVLLVASTGAVKG